MRIMLLVLIWAAIPPALLWILSCFPKRRQLDNPLAREQTWTCKPGVLLYAVIIGALLVDVLAWRRSPLGTMVDGDLLIFEARLIGPYLIVGATLLAYLRRIGRPVRISLGLTFDRQAHACTGAIAIYAFLTAGRAALTYYTESDWDWLYVNPIFGDLLSRISMGHALAIAAILGIASVVEELVFRGFTLMPLARIIGPSGAVGVTALAFSMSHFNFGPGLLFLFLMGSFLGWQTYQTGALVRPITFHLLWNLCATSDLVLGRLRAQGLHLTAQEHWRYIGAGALLVGILASLTTLFLKQTRKPDVLTAPY